MKTLSTLHYGVTHSIYANKLHLFFHLLFSRNYIIVVHGIRSGFGIPLYDKKSKNKNKGALNKFLYRTPSYRIISADHYSRQETAEKRFA